MRSWVRFDAANTGRPPSYTIGFALATNVNDEQNTSSPGRTPASRSARCSAAVPEESAAEDGLKREWSRPDLGRNTHLAYAFQWYALSLAIFITKNGTAVL